MNLNPWVVKAGGDLLAYESIRKKIFNDLLKIKKKTPVLLVHGGGPQIQKALKKNRIPNKFIGGRRFTSSKAMKVVEETLCGVVNTNLVNELNQKGAWALGLSGKDSNIMVARPLKGLGRAGHPQKIRDEVLSLLLENNVLPVMSSVATDKKGGSLNINADDAASALAIALKASNLVFLTNVSGVKDKQKKRIPILRPTKIHQLVQQDVIVGGMIPKVQSALNALKKGVKQVTITNGQKGIRSEYGTRILSR